MKASALPMDDPVVETEVADSEPERRSGPWKLIAIVIVVTLVGVWLIPSDAPEEEPTVASRPDPTAQDPAAPPSLLRDEAPDTGSAGTAEEAAGPETMVDDHPGGKARALIARMRKEGDIDPERVLAVATQAQAEGELADAYLLYFFAAREGSGRAALELGTQADPATRDPLNSVFGAPDLNQAYKWYKIAAGNGESEARDRLADLQARVEQMAASGDPQAQRISLLWQ